MWTLRRPSDEHIRAFLLRQAQEAFSYAEVGATATEPPGGYDVDHNRIQLGTGQAVFDAACTALRNWQQFPAPGTSVIPSDAPLQPGSTVGVLAWTFGLWWLNAARIIYVIDEAGQVRRFGFAYGTLPAHVERGEERFSVEWHDDDSVWYDILAFSQPRYWMTRIAYPLTRWMQKRFARDSKAAMLRSVEAAVRGEAVER
jgi:uncharacterized protein (UPF0548 family)